MSGGESPSVDEVGCCYILHCQAEGFEHCYLVGGLPEPSRDPADFADDALEASAYDMKPAPATNAPAELTARELEILQLIARGVRNRDIAEQLVITEKTVANHVSNIYSKLQVADPVEAMLRAPEAGLE